MELIYAIMGFLILLLILELTFYALTILKNPDEKKIRRRLTEFTAIDSYSSEVVSDITRKRIFSDLPFLQKVISSVPVIMKMDKLLLQANTNYTLGFYLLASFSSSVITLFFVHYFTRQILLGFGVGIAAFFLPWWYLKIKKKRRIKRAIEQMPDAMDLISRAMKAGHAFSTGMKFVGEEYGAPLGPEFSQAIDEINFGVATQEALTNLAKRVGCMELEYFVVSVILQRESGGNLAEILTQLGTILRERFKLRGKIKALAAEGKLTAIILFAIPLGIAFFTWIVKPDLIETLFSDPIGRMMAAGSGIMMVCGFFIIRKLIRFDI
jgi:tight adherence protein B